MREAAPEPEIILDLSRLLSRVFHATPTGVDRCEMAYARELMRVVPHRLSFAAVHPLGLFGRLEQSAVLRFLDATEDRWDRKGRNSPGEMHRVGMAALARLRPRCVWRNLSGLRPFYIKPSPNNLTKPRRIAAILKREQAQLVCLVHDLIPLQYPEYAREGGAADHEARVRTILSLAAGVVCNSQATLDALTPWMDRHGRHPKAVVAHLGTHTYAGADLPSAPAGATDGRPYFICIGTIEPRKNHLLLLNLWRQMSEQHGAANIPKLIIIGRRGWENEQVVDMLERCPALKGCVEEQGRLSDRQVATLLPDARALLMPSFAEGYGMPVTEALALGVRVICSDLPALREAGGTAPIFLDPLDGPGWRRAVDEHVITRPQTRQRPPHWRAPTWQDHVAKVLKLVHSLAT